MAFKKKCIVMLKHGIINKEAVATVGACFRMITPRESNYGSPPTDEPYPVAKTIFEIPCFGFQVNLSGTPSGNQTW